jgi:NADH:ubiquinone oxidoreductase subunit D
MSWDQVGQIVLMVIGAAGTAVVFVWQLRPKAEAFVDKRVGIRVDPLLIAINGVAETLADQEDERQRFHLSTTAELARITGALGTLRNEVDQNTAGNERGRDGLNELRDAGDHLRLRAHDLEIKTGLRALGAVSMDGK